MSALRTQREYFKAPEVRPCATGAAIGHADHTQPVESTLFTFRQYSAGVPKIESTSRDTVLSFTNAPPAMRKPAAPKKGGADVLGAVTGVVFSTDDHPDPQPFKTRAQLKASKLFKTCAFMMNRSVSSAIFLKIAANPGPPNSW